MPVSPLRDGIPSAANDPRLNYDAFRPYSNKGKPRFFKDARRKLLDRFVDDIFAQIGAMSNDELWNLIQAADSVSPINCAWSTYAIAELVRGVAAHDLKTRLPSDTDGSPEGPDRDGLDGKAATAGAEGIAEDIQP